MSWVRFDDQRALNRKLRAAGLEARGLDEAAICQVAADMTDGFISEDTVEMLAVAHRCRHWRKVVAVLVEVGRWEPAEGGWTICNYLEFNPTRAEWEAELARKREAGRRGGQASAQARGQAHGQAPASASASRSGQAGRQPDPSRPVPTRPDPLKSSSGQPIQDPSSSHTGDDDEVSKAMRTLAERDLARRVAEKGPVGKPESWLERVARNRRHQHAADLEAMVGLTAAEIVTRLDPQPGDPEPSAEDRAAAAAAALRQRHQLPPCQACDDTGWAGADPGNGKCPCGRLYTAAERLAAKNGSGR